MNMSYSTYIALSFPVKSLKIPDEYCTQEPMDLLLHYLSICSIVLPMNPLCMHTYRTCFCLGSIYYMYTLLEIALHIALCTYIYICIYVYASVSL